MGGNSSFNQPSLIETSPRQLLQPQSSLPHQTSVNWSPNQSQSSTQSQQSSNQSPHFLQQSPQSAATLQPSPVSGAILQPSPVFGQSALQPSPVSGAMLQPSPVFGQSAPDYVSLDSQSAEVYYHQQNDVCDYDQSGSVASEQTDQSGASIPPEQVLPLPAGQLPEGEDVSKSLCFMKLVQ